MPAVLFAAPGPWHMLHAPSPPCSFFSDWSEASGLNLSPPQSRLPGPPRPCPRPPVVSSHSLVCWPSSDASTFWAGTVLLRKAAAHSGRLISIGTSCGPASSAGCTLGPLRGCLAAQEMNPGQHPRVGLEHTWRILQPSCQLGGFGGTSRHQQPGRAVPWQGSARPLVGNGGLYIRDKLPTALCQPWPLQPRAPSVVTRHTL